MKFELVLHDEIFLCHDDGDDDDDDDDDVLMDHLVDDGRGAAAAAEIGCEASSFYLMLPVAAAYYDNQHRDPPSIVPFGMIPCLMPFFHSSRKTTFLGLECLSSGRIPMPWTGKEGIFFRRR